MVKILLREEKAQGHSGTRTRGVSFGSAGLNPSIAERPGSKAPSMLKRGFSMGMGMSDEGGPKQEKGAPS